MLTVVTFTKNDRPEMLDRCQAAVALALPAGATHKVIECLDPTKFQQLRYDAVQSDDFVAFVDDDDFVDATSLSMCLKALQNSNAGVAFTAHRMVDPTGVEIQRFDFPSMKVPYMSITQHPRVAHHLVMYRKSAVTQKSLDLANQFGMGIEWFMTAEAALTAGAVYVPVVGYSWTYHGKQLTTGANETYGAKIPEMSKAIQKAFPGNLDLVPVFKG
jgi:hypothetical protein